MLKRSEETKLAIMDALKYRPMCNADLVLNIELEGHVSMAYIAQQLGELERDGYVKMDATASVMPLYKHASESSLSELRAKLLPHRDPVREGHEFEATRAQRYAARYRNQTGADLDNES